MPHASGVYAIIYRLMSGIQDSINSKITPNKNSSPIIVTVEMGYGHLRAAYTLAELFATEVTRMDLPPIASPAEVAAWRGILKFYNGLSQACDWPAAGPAARAILKRITEIPPLQACINADTSTVLTRLADSLTGSIVGRRLRSMIDSSGRPILATYPAAALAARHVPGARVFCLATDTDINRAWAPANASNPCIEYLAPVVSVIDRLRSFGVPEGRIHLTGFPLPAKLIAECKSMLVHRLHKLDPTSAFRRQTGNKITSLVQGFSNDSSNEPIALTVAIGGAGAQVGYVGQILRSVQKLVISGRLRLNLIAGTRADVAEFFRRMVQTAGLETQKEVKILFAADMRDYFQVFTDCLANTDLLWTKPSELVFYAALGLPIVLSNPVGSQEHANRNWLLSNDAGLDAGDPSELGPRLEDLLSSGELSRIAWNGYSRLDRKGSDRIVEIVNSTL